MLYITEVRKINAAFLAHLRFSLSDVALVMGRISLLASAVVIVSPSLASQGIPSGVVIQATSDGTLQLQNAISQAVENPVLVKVEGNKCHIVAEGKEAENYLSNIENNEAGKEKIWLYILAPKSEVHPLKTVGEIHEIRDLEKASRWMDDYRYFTKAISRETERAAQGQAGLSDILSLLDIAANVIEVVGAAGGVSLWLTRKLLERRRQSSNPLINTYVGQAERILEFFEKVPEARINDISRGTEIPKNNLVYFLKSLGFEHEPTCYWHPPNIPQELLKPAIASAETKRKIRPITTFVAKLFFITLIIGGMVFAILSNLDATILAILLLITVSLFVFIIVK